jgi:hypothetical protein
MRYFSFNDYETNSVKTMSESEILDHYWDYWSNKMSERGLSSLITKENCINDFIVTNWAWEVFPDQAPAGWDDLTNVR